MLICVVIHQVIVS